MMAHYLSKNVASRKHLGLNIHIQDWTVPWGSNRSRLPEFLHIRHTKVVRLSAFRIGLNEPQEISLILISVRV